MRDLLADYREWFYDKTRIYKVYEKEYRMGFNKFIEYTVNGPKDIDLAYFMELMGDNYTIVEIGNAMRDSPMLSSDKIFKHCLEERKSKLIKLWIEE